MVGKQQIDMLAKIARCYKLIVIKSTKGMEINLLNKQALILALENSQIESGDTVYITGNMGKLGIPVNEDGNKMRNKKDILNFYSETIQEYLGENGTIVFPTHTWGLVKGSEVFDPENTACDYLFSEFLRTNLDCKRQLHPFASVAAFGAKAEQIISSKITRHAYGPHTPFEYLRNNRSIHLSIGLEISQSFSAAHYCEFVCGVPYRYTKSFIKQIKDQESRVEMEEFFLYVCYLNPNLTRDRNKKLFARGNIKPLQQNIGRGIIETLDLDATINTYIELMMDDPYIWLKEIDGEKDLWPWFN